MADVLPFKKPGKKKADKKPAAKNTVVKSSIVKKTGNTLCKSGFHKWKADKETDFSVKQGKLATRYVCERCGISKTGFT